MMETQELEKIAVTLRVGNAELPIEFAVPSEKVRLRRMLPILRQMSNAFISRGLEGLPEGAEISCKAGCGACCRQIVPISEAEAYDIRDLLDAMPEERRLVIRQRFADAMRTLTEANFFARLDAASRGDESEYQEMVREYFRFNIECPFLEDQSCSIHESRPITCREYLVTSPAELCASAEGTGVENVHHFFQVKEALISLSRHRTSEQLPYVPLIALMAFTEADRDDSPERTGRDWARDFFTKLAAFSRPADSV